MKFALLLGTLCRAALPAHAAEAPGLPILAARLPARPFPCALGGEATRPAEVLRGKPALLVFADSRGGVPREVAAAVAELRAEFGPWLGWGAVAVGPRAADGPPEGLGGLRLDAFWSDSDGAWRAAFRVAELPAVVLVTEEGYLARRHAGARAGDEAAISAGIERLIAAGKLRGRAARDFKLEEVGTGRLVTLADAATREYTLLLSLRTDCEACFDQLALCDRIRQERPGRVTLVAINHDPRGVARAASPAGEGRLRADVVLRDPEQRFAARYGLGGVPAVVVVDGAGRVVLARQGFQRDEAPLLAGELGRVLDTPAASDEESLRFAEFRRVRAEGLALLAQGRAGLAAFFFERALELFPEQYTVQALLAEAHQAAGSPRDAAAAYGRYLASEPLPCDRERVVGQIRTLASAP